MKEGEIKLFKAIGETSIVVEYCDSKVTNRKKKIVDRRFFGFKSGTAEMIKRGSWEMQSYQHLKISRWEYTLNMVTKYVDLKLNI